MAMNTFGRQLAIISRKYEAAVYSITIRGLVDLDQDIIATLATFAI